MQESKEMNVRILAREAIRSGKDTQYFIPPVEVTNFWRTQMYQEMFQWTKEESVTRGASYCRNFLDEERKTWFKKFSLKRRAVTTINRLRTGHTSLAESFYRFRIVASPICARCDVEETPNYVFWECIEFEEQRKKLRRGLVEARGFLPHCVEYLLVSLDVDIIYMLEKFICSISKHI